MVIESVGVLRCMEYYNPIRFGLKQYVMILNAVEVQHKYPREQFLFQQEAQWYDRTDPLLLR